MMISGFLSDWLPHNHIVYFYRITGLQLKKNKGMNAYLINYVFDYNGTGGGITAHRLAVGGAFSDFDTCITSMKVNVLL